MAVKNLPVILFTFLALIFVGFYDNYRSIDFIGELKVIFFDIGQGDATLIITPKGNDILIDGGPDNTLIKKLGHYLPFFDRTIELVILTHPDNDHVAGLIEVFRRYRVEKILMTGVLAEAPSYQAWLEEISKTDVEVEIIDSPKIVKLDDEVLFDIFFPDKNFNNQSVESTNNTSITGKIIYRQTSLMMTGDLEIEEELIKSGFNLKSDIYHVGHHGANNANNLAFISAVGPQSAIISVGQNNRYGHPQYRTLKNLNKLGINIFRTDQQGDIVFKSDGQKWQSNP